MSALICGITMTDHQFNKQRLKVTMHSDGHLSYRLKSYLGSTSFAISNLQLKDPLPEMRSDTLEQTIVSIMDALHTGIPKPTATDVYATVAKPKWVPSDPWDNHPDHGVEDWREEVWMSETRLSYAEWVNVRLAQ